MSWAIISERKHDSVQRERYELFKMNIPTWVCSPFAFHNCLQIIFQSLGLQRSWYRWLRTSITMLRDHHGLILQEFLRTVESCSGSYFLLKFDKVLHIYPPLELWRFICYLPATRTKNYELISLLQYTRPQAGTDLISSSALKKINLARYSGIGDCKFSEIQWSMSWA